MWNLKNLFKIQRTGPLVEDIVNIVIDALNSSKKYFQIKSERKKADIVKSQLLKLKAPHIVYVVNSLKEVRDEVRSKENYILTVLYNAVITKELDTTLVVARIQNNP